MQIERLKLNNFRNYESLDVKFSNGFNVIVGDNAQG
ncbi:MAG: AAA family ATPase, partial [Clostridia bacterium]|nr:AAA family ATPase [Clostridia bacterium]